MAKTPKSQRLLHSIKPAMELADERISSILLVVSMVANIAVLPLFPIGVMPLIRTELMTMQVAVMALCAFTYFRLRVKKKFSIRAVWTLAVLQVALPCANLFVTMRDSPDLDTRWFAAVTCLSVAFLVIFLSPGVDGKWWRVVPPIAIGVAIADIHAPRPLFAYSMGFFFIAAASCLRVGFGLVIRRELLKDHRVKRLTRLAERRKVTSEQRLARRIHRSFKAPRRIDYRDDVEVQSHQKSHGAFGGDWTMVNKLDDGRVVAFVADVTGKGLQASLVLRTLQSLWALVHSRGDFEAESWLRQLNRALVVLGEREPHTMTLGLLVVDSTQLTYYRCGHLPLVRLGFDKSEGADVSLYWGEGDILGLRPDMALKAVTIPWPEGDFRLFLGSDGVFPSGRPKRKLLVELSTALDEQGSRAIGELSTDDDRTLVTVTRRARVLKAAA